MQRLRDARSLVFDHFLISRADSNISNKQKMEQENPLAAGAPAITGDDPLCLGFSLLQKKKSTLS